MHSCKQISTFQRNNVVSVFRIGNEDGIFLQMVNIHLQAWMISWFWRQFEKLQLDNIKTYLWMAIPFLLKSITSMTCVRIKLIGQYVPDSPHADYCVCSLFMCLFFLNKNGNSEGHLLSPLHSAIHLLYEITCEQLNGFSSHLILQNCMNKCWDDSTLILKEQF